MFAFSGRSAFAAALAIPLMAGVPAAPALADGKDFAAGVVTGVIGSAIVRDANRKKRQRYAPAPAPARTQPAPRYYTSSAEVRQEQTALNFFGFPAGYADGVAGRKTRNAISGFQGWMGYPVTGYLTPEQAQFLLDSYNRAIAGGALTQQQIAANPNGTKGLLWMYRDEQASG